MMWKAVLAGLPLFRLAAAAIEAHNILRVAPLTENDSMGMTVWVDGQIICHGYESAVESSSITDFCLRNHDGKGEGCAPGYAYCTTDNGRRGNLEYFENSVLKQTFELGTKNWDTWEDPNACLVFPGDNGDTSFKCSYWEGCVSTSDQDTCKLCSKNAECGVKNELDPPKEFPYPKPFKAMVIGDSISQGNEGDFTWRYRVWEWIKDNQEYDVDMVGPWKGTWPRLGPEYAVPTPPKIPGVDDYADDRPKEGGKYHRDVSSSFPDHHFARWGQLVHTSKGLTRDFVQQYQPSHILLMLGFNDLGWFVGDVSQVINDLSELVVEAQKGKDGVQILVANIPHRSKIGGRDDLIEMTDQVNRRLELQVPTWNRGFSRTVLVDIAGNYNCKPGGCPDGTDGLHPKPIGEYHIAKAFTDVLVDRFFFSGGKLKIPSSVPERSATVPTSFQATADAKGLKLSWDRLFGVTGYEVRTRLKGLPDWGTPFPCGTNAYYQSWVLKDQEWEGQVRSIMGDDNKSAWSGTKSAVMKPATLPGPKNVVTKPEGNNIKISWDAVAGAERYGAIYYDTDGTAFMMIIGSHKTSYTVEGVNPGHRYALGVETWSSTGGGFPTMGFDVLGQKGTPAMPTNFKVFSVDPTTVRLTWSASANAAGYRVWLRNFNEGGNLEADPYGSTSSTSKEIFFLFPGVWNFEFAVSAYNGNLESPRSNIIKAPKP